MKLQESAGISFSLSFLIQILTAIVLGVWAYSQLDARISALQNSSDSYDESITRIEETMDEAQDQPISSDYVQNTTLQAHQRELEDVKDRLQVLEMRLYERAFSP
jgi:chromosome segregation ATPase